VISASATIFAPFTIVPMSGPFLFAGLPLPPPASAAESAVIDSEIANNAGPMNIAFLDITCFPYPVNAKHPYFLSPNQRDLKVRTP
jgi:hypothetical protein